MDTQTVPYQPEVLLRGVNCLVVFQNNVLSLTDVFFTPVKVAFSFLG